MKPVWIVTTMRSGSSYLCYLLNSILKPDPKITEWLSLAGSRQMYGKDTVGMNKDQRTKLFKEKGIPHNLKLPYVHYKQLAESKALIEQLKPAIIYLDRANNIDKAVSEYFMKTTQVAHLSTDTKLSKKADPITSMNKPTDKIIKKYRKGINRDQLMKIYNDTVRRNKKCKELVGTFDKHLHVSYNELNNQPKVTLRKICPFLGVKIDDKLINEAVAKCPFITTRKKCSEQYKRAKEILQNKVKSEVQCYHTI